ncbi:nodulation protein NfeD [Caldichromatium japonicum]|uniref:Nodulation protein NfeD n=1 Tax=Caldichromatium japonicum TaxID=2699430 RepID=A0A6G7VEW8_9GAMM|nr:nodulation protein NfeD [Caldichromatium japonicum]
MGWPRALLILGALCSISGSVAQGAEAWLIELAGPIGPASAAYVDETLEAAQDKGVGLLILRLDTPGGLDISMRAIVKSITASPIPVACYVAPTGARAASAGTYILMSCPVAAMAPGTNLGAATPIQIGGLPAPSHLQEGEAKPEAKTAHETKLINDAAAYLGALARLHGRNADWAERAVREGASLGAEEALALGVIDLIAADPQELLAALDGRGLRIQQEERLLATKDLHLSERPPNWHIRMLAIISDPSIAYILMLIGIYGLIYEFANPGAVLPGTLGALSLLLALYAFQLLPVNYVGLALIGLGVLLMIAEVLSPSLGGLGMGGVAAFIIGSLILIDSEVMSVPLALILGAALTSTGLILIVVRLALKAQVQPVVSGSEQLIGAVGTALTDLALEGSVRVEGEVWSARAECAIPAGAPVRVKGRSGLTLIIEPVQRPP